MKARSILSALEFEDHRAAMVAIYADAGFYLGVAVALRFMGDVASVDQER